MQAYPLTVESYLDESTRLRNELNGVLAVAEQIAHRRGDSVAFKGELMTTPERAFPMLKERFEQHGYTPLLRKDGGHYVVVASRGVIGAWSETRTWIQALLLVATIITTTFAGTAFAPVSAPQALRAWRASGELLPLLEVLLGGLSFSIPLLLILGVHELGHYFMGRWHGVHVTLPYFIPVPIGLGTFGAFIQMKSPAESRGALFDVGLAGPIAGFLVALPLFVLGLLLSTVGEPVRAGAILLGQSVLVGGLIDWLVPHAAGQVVYLHPIAIASWFGLLVTGFNLLPIGQLDGGHVAYAALGRWARPLGLLVFAAMIALGYFFWSGWYMWAFFALITGIRHPAPLNDITPLDFKRKVLALLSVVLFAVVISIRPF
jgi:membrane-associated protease RseP (regulator of RpoE activity)